MEFNHKSSRSCPLYLWRAIDVTFEVIDYYDVKFGHNYVSRNGEEYFIKSFRPAPNHNLGYLGRGPSHGYINYCA